jgi:hypothetical protein
VTVIWSLVAGTADGLAVKSEANGAFGDASSIVGGVETGA